MSTMPRKKHLESDTKAEVKKLLDEHGWFWFSPPAGAFGVSGIADILAVKTGMFMAIETKRGTKKPEPTTLQVGFLNSIRAEDHFALVVNDARLAVFQAFLEALDRSTAAVSAKQPIAPEDGAMMLNTIREMTGEL